MWPYLTVPFEGHIRLFKKLIVGVHIAYQVVEKCNRFLFISNIIDGITVDVLASSAGDRGFKPLSGQDYWAGICCLSAALRCKQRLADSEWG
jgi:hypothetical protein